MSRAKRLAKVERIVGGPSEDELFWQAYEKYSRNIVLLTDPATRHLPEEPLTREEEAALRSRGIDGLATWLWYGVDEEEVLAMEAQAEATT